MKIFFLNTWKRFIRSQSVNVILSTSGQLSNLLSRILYRKYLKRFQSQLSNTSTSRILIAFENAGIGNIIEATPMIQAIRMLWPASHITLVTKHTNLFDSWCVPDLVVSSFEHINHQSFHLTFFPYWCIQKIPKPGLKIKFGNTHLTQLLNKNCFLKPEKEYYMDMSKKVGYKGQTPLLYVPIKTPINAYIPKKTYLCLVPAGKNDSRWRFKKWPYYSQLVNALSRKYPNMQICLIGTMEDSIELKHSKNILDLRGKLSLSETAWILKNACCAIGNDCGPMHIASAVNIPSVVIFGPTCILKNAYFGKTTMLYPKKLKCWPCQYDIEHLDNCQTGQCIKSIKFEQVMSSVQQILQKCTKC